MKQILQIFWRIEKNILKSVSNRFPDSAPMLLATFIFQIYENTPGANPLRLFTVVIYEFW